MDGVTPTEADIARAREIAYADYCDIKNDLAASIATALAQARADGLEEAAKIADERTKALEAVAVAYERWEADLISDNDCWRDPSGLPSITEELWDRCVEIQSMRNEALGRFK